MNYRYSFLAWLALICTTIGCGYGEISPLAYDYSMALYSITNRRAADRLDGVEEQIHASHAEGKLTDPEQRWLQAIIDDARNGDWAAASRATRRLMEDQLTPESI